MRTTVTTYRIANAGHSPLSIHLEPWGDQYTLAPGEDANLLVQNAGTHPLDWEFQEGKLVISSLAASNAWLTLQKMPA